MRRIVVALITLSLAFGLVGCGGGGDEATDAGTDTATDAPVVVPQTTEEAEVDRSPVETGFPEPFPAIESTEVPSAIQQKLDDGRPMVLFFYDSAEVVTKDQRTELDAALKEYRGLIDLVTYDVAGKDGTSDEDAQLAAVLASDLGVASTPYVIMVDGNGFITWRFQGYVDRDVIDREILRATE